MSRRIFRATVTLGAAAAAGLTFASSAVGAPYDTATTSRLSVHNLGAQTTAASNNVSISRAGRYVAFASTDPTIVPNDRNGRLPDLYVNDRVKKTVTLVGRDDTGAQPSGEVDGVYLSGPAKLSGDGTRIAYSFSGGCGHSCPTVYLNNLATGHVDYVAGGTVADISSTGRYVLVDSEDGYSQNEWLQLVDTQTGDRFPVWETAEHGGTGFVSSGAVSTDGRYVAYSLAGYGVFRYDRQTMTTASVAAGGTNPVMTPNGRYVAFQSSAAYGTPDTNKKVDVFRKDMTTKVIVRVSVGGAATQANGDSYPQSISDNGDFVAFTSAATNLVKGDTNKRTDVFVRQIGAKLTKRVSLTTKAAQANGGSPEPSISGDGKHVVFVSTASNLISGDTNGVADVFVRETAKPS